MMRTERHFGQTVWGATSAFAAVDLVLRSGLCVMMALQVMTLSLVHNVTLMTRWPTAEDGDGWM